MVQIPFEISSVSGKIYIYIGFLKTNHYRKLKIICFLSVVDLKVLSLRSCPLVTSDTILSCLHFRFLQKFDCVAAERVPSSYVVNIILQNPSLTHVAANFDKYEEEVMLKECNKTQRPMKLINLVTFVNTFYLQMLQLRDKINDNSNDSGDSEGDSDDDDDDDEEA